MSIKVLMPDQTAFDRKKRSSDKNEIKWPCNACATANIQFVDKLTVARKKN